MQSVSDARTYAPVNFRETPPVDHAPLGADVVTRSGAAAVAGGEAPGLVSSQTSVPHTFPPMRIDREASRLKRLRCSVLTAARLHVKQKARWKVAMLTLTYAPQHDWAAFQVSDLVRHIRKYLARKGIEMRYVWVQEFTKKGRPHYHLLLWLPLGITLPKPDKRGWWPFGFTKIEWARNAIGYIAKYASKADSLHPPARGARMHGNGGVTGDDLLEQRWWKLPTWCRALADVQDRVRRAPPRSGGGFINPGTGEVYRSPWVVYFSGGYVWLKAKEGVTS
jgi:hypothetical protein